MLHTQGSQPDNQVRETNGHTDRAEPYSANEPTDLARPPSDLRLASITRDQVRDVDLMVDYAVRPALEHPDVLRDIAFAKRQVIEGQVSSEVGARSIAASTKLVRIISPATPVSIKIPAARSG